MQKKVINVEGMHCNACKLIIEKAVIEIRNVKEVRANVKKGTVEISYDIKEPNFNKIEEIIEENGYKICKEKVKKIWFSKDKKNYIIFIVSLIGFLILYFIFKKVGRFNTDFSNQNSELTLGFATLIGLIAGFSSCMAVVGGLVLALSSKRNSENEDTKFVNKFVPHIWFNLGRIVGFGFFGGVLGLLGGILRLSPIFLSIMTLIVGILLILLGLNLTKISPKFDTLLSIPTGKLFQKGNDKIKDKNQIIGSICGGILTFFLPCGFTFSMQVYALSTGSFWMGALVMMMFAIGTIPGLLGVGAFSSIFRGKTAKIFYQIIGVLVLLLGIYNISNVWTNVQGLFLKNNIVENQNIESINMTYTNNGLTPSSITVEIGKTYNIIINSQTTIYGCMSTITLPGLDNSIKDIVKGTSISFNFTPTKAGTFEFKCAMGISHNAQVIVK